MPGYDRSGPEGQGPRSGRQGGICWRMENPAGSGIGMGRGRGSGGRGFGVQTRQQQRSAAPVAQGAAEVQENPLSDLANLKQQYLAAEKMLRSLAEKIDALESGR